ncbi:hypothetical protein HZH66_008251 [Vespula vulgaris]|uniref:Uncharacterized protein n=1 Tax=Vespula vulgaris TaxID=7454 RepID=A0A834JVD3_VESVU|nr:hypothetical protein HZH66_008251 [Vespula vulgaris]
MLFLKRQAFNGRDIKKEVREDEITCGVHLSLKVALNLSSRLVKSKSLGDSHVAREQRQHQNLCKEPACSTIAKLICSKLSSHTKYSLSGNKVFYQSAMALRAT